MIEPVNGKTYQVWGGLVEQKERLIGGTLTDLDDSQKTKIVDVTLKPCGEASAWFEVVGEDFNCGANVEYCGVTGARDGGLMVAGPNFAGFSIKNREDVKP